MSELNDIRERVAGHVPGPWEFDPTEMGSANGRAYYGIVTPEFVSYAIRVGVYAEDYRGGSHREERCIANAELVAAAPDLLRIATEQAERINELEAIAKKAGKFALMDSRDKEALLSRELREYQSCAEECAALVVKESEA